VHANILTEAAVKQTHNFRRQTGISRLNKNAKGDDKLAESFPIHDV